MARDSCALPSRDGFSSPVEVSEELLVPQMYLVSIFGNSKRVPAVQAREDGIAAKGRLHAFVRG